MAPATIAALAGSALVYGAWLQYLFLIPREKVPRRPVVHALVIGVGMVGTLASVVLAPTWPMFVSAAPALAFGGLFFWLLTIATLPSVKIAVEVGGPLPEFAALGAGSEPWTSGNLRGKRTLFKVFRGHW